MVRTHGVVMSHLAARPHALPSADKVKEDFNKLYDGDCRSSMLQWHTFDQTKKEELISKEENIIFDGLATFGTGHLPLGRGRVGEHANRYGSAYKMLTLGTNVELVRRFVGKMSTASQLSEEKTTVIEQLLSNMTRASELTAELEANSGRNSLPYGLTIPTRVCNLYLNGDGIGEHRAYDFEDGGEEQEYIPVAGLKNARDADQSLEGKKKFETLLKAKSTQTRGTRPNLHFEKLLACVLIRDDLSLQRSSLASLLGEQIPQERSSTSRAPHRAAKRRRRNLRSINLVGRIQMPMITAIPSLKCVSGPCTSCP